MDIDWVTAMLLSFRYGGKKGKVQRLETSKDVIVVRSESYHLPVHTTLSAKARRALDDLTPIADMQAAGVQLFAAPKGAAGAAQRARGILKKEKEVRFAGRALHDPRTRLPVVYTENAFVKFHATVSQSRRIKLLQEFKLSVKREL
jgi:hypothetical protein